MLKYLMVLSDGAVQYADCISAEGWDYPDKCPWYDSKQSDGEASVMQEFGGMWSSPFIYIAPRYTLARLGSNW